MPISFSLSKQSALPSKTNISSHLCIDGIGSNMSSKSVSSGLEQHLNLLLDVIRSQRWSSFETIALSNPDVYQMINNALPKHEQNMTLLHAVLRYNPPLETVIKMILRLQDGSNDCNNLIDAVRAQDSMGRTPIHIAAACDANAMIIKLLGSADPTACSSLDTSGRTPLHLACINEDNETSQYPTRHGPPSIETVRALLSVSLEPALIEDEDDMSALEYAIISDANIDVVQLLQLATMKCQTTNKKRRKSFDDDESSVESEHSSVQCIDSSQRQRKRRACCHLIM